MNCVFIRSWIKCGPVTFRWWQSSGITYFNEHKKINRWRSIRYHEYIIQIRTWGQCREQYWLYQPPRDKILSDEKRRAICSSFGGYIVIVSVLFKPLSAFVHLDGKKTQIRIRKHIALFFLAHHIFHVFNCLQILFLTNTCILVVCAPQWFVNICIWFAR